MPKKRYKTEVGIVGTLSSALSGIYVGGVGALEAIRLKGIASYLAWHRSNPWRQGRLGCYALQAQSISEGAYHSATGKRK